ncbi:MAG: LysR family transcriptional regulator [Myxococcales bacterium]
MDIPELHADRLRAFLAVAREGGFSRAARALGRTQSSLSQAVRALELELGETLFVRDARDIELTEAGQILREHAERAFQENRTRAGRLVVAAQAHPRHLARRHQ